ncbi:hypothetical protein [Streptococcus himalayensis]|uniref:Phage protein n=1 Tax=Streptococcus himalayensis TaxID=1888195 RepID=A0A917A825_9STRE|nr:hypothetical protein [Streptococcus himalayensis]GGE34606.1 hypothetical protein GCM10011510_14910 [Streptococcus himalayensis]
MTTFNSIQQEIKQIRSALQKAQEATGMSELSLLSARLKGIEFDLKQLLYIEVPELNDSKKYDALFQGNDIIFGESFLERKAVRQSFWKQLAKLFISSKDEQSAFVKQAEAEYMHIVSSHKELHSKARVSA